MNRPAQFFKANPSLTWWATTAAESAYVSTTWTVPPSGEMYHSYESVPGWFLAPETISSMSSLNVSSLPSLTASSFTQETCPFTEFSFPCRLDMSDENDSGVVGPIRLKRRGWAVSPVFECG